MTYHYGKSGKEIWLDSIKYTGNGSMQPYAKVEFGYTTLPLNMGQNTYFIGGRSVPQTKLLETITVKYGGSIVRKYKFNYNINDSGERTTHLKEVILLSPNNLQLNATTITWNAQNNVIEKQSLSNFSTGKIIFGDFNGDGYSDYVVYNIGAGITRTWKLFLKNPSNNTFYEAKSGTSNESYAYVADFTGDGKDDLILAQNWNTPNATYKINVYAYENNGFVSVYSESVDYFFQAHLGDFNGDGKVDIMYEQRSATGIIGILRFSHHDF
jgi:hypothetical protein